MSLDLCVISLVLFFAFLGAMTGAAKQVAHWVALFVAYFCARPLGELLAPHLFRSPKMLGIVLGTVIVFLVTMVVVRFALSRILSRVLAGHAQERVSVDRALGFLLGGGKVAAMAFVVLSALVFVQSHVAVAGKRVAFASQGSYTMQLAKKYNLFEMTQFSAVKDLTRVAQAAQKPESAAKLASDPAYKALLKDPRFKEILAQPSLKKALAANDYPTLLRNDTVLDMVQDPTLAARLNAAALAANER